MKQTYNLYKLLFLFCTAFIAHGAVAQVTGNKYVNAVNTSSIVNTQGATITAKTPAGTSAGNTWNYTIQKAFDGDSEGTWWTSSQQGTINIDIAFTSEITLAYFHIYSGGSSQQREQSVVVYTSQNGSSWTEVKSFTGNRNVRHNDYILDSPLKTQYLRLQLTTGRWDYSLAINEITLYSSTENASLTHKASKWFDLREFISEAAKGLDTFNDDTPWFTLQNGSTQVQASHVYMDTIYVHKGTSVTLEVPDKLNNSSVTSYQRWYSFRTDQTFRTQNTGQDEVWDLLTPPGNTSPYRFENGYVGKPITTNDLITMNFYVPTDDEFNRWFSNIASNYDNNYYLVGCDVSGYTDFTQNFNSQTSGNSQFYPSNQTDGKSYEPTLTHRIIYYIIAVDDRDSGSGATQTWKDGMGRLKDEAYHGGGNDGKYLEEYDITFPFTRVSNNTRELVALSKDARSYAIPDARNDNNTLSVKLVDGGSGITLATTNLSGQSRVIQFNYPNTNPNDGTQYVNANNSTATIYVTKTVDGTIYNIAKYNLTFVRSTRLLTESQLQQIEAGTIQDDNLKYYQFRTDKYLSENYDLLTQLNFDYDTEVGNMYGQNGFYPFPLDWTSSSYSFYDGAVGNDFKNTNKYPEWGYYSIMSGFIENIANWSGAPQGHVLPNSTYHMYIDASDRPGVIARLPFRQKLCAGSEMFVTAWVKSAGYSSTTPDAGMLFSVMGVKKNATGQDVYVPIYRHATGQIRRTDYLSGMPGTGSGTNEWMQMYFSFIVENDVEYESYVLQVDNNSESTSGGDMYIDDIRVYLATASAKVSQLEAACTNERTMMSIELDWDRILSRLGDVEGTDGIEGIDFCFIDKAKYESWLAENPVDYEGAIEASVVEIGNNEEGEGFYNEKYVTMHFDLTFENNASYDDKPHPRLARDNEGTGENKGKYFFYRKTDEAGLRSLAVDFYSALTPNRSYMMLIQINDGNLAAASDFAEGINDACSINTPFYVTAQSLLRVNGEVVDPTTDFCAGQIFSFSAQVRVPKSDEDGTESYITIDQGVYFDWFFGTEEEFLAANPKYGGQSLQSALTTFRSVFPYKGDLDEVHEGEYDNIDGYKVTITQDIIDIINDYLNQDPPEGGQNNRLVLYRDKLDITLLKDGLQLVIQPIQTLVPPSEAIDTTLWANVCWSYIPVELHASGEAPQLRAGFNPLKYPSNDFNPGLRIGLSQIAELKENKTLKISLRGAKTVTEDVKSLGLVTSASPEVFNKIYLIRTDDPEYQKFFTTDFSEYSLPVGTIKKLLAVDYESDPNYDDHMEIYFDTQTTQSNGFRFQPKEGYFYELAFHFEEKTDGGISANTCFGVFNIEMKVVPEYLVWQGKSASANWNNDENWRRADNGDLKKASNDNYPTNLANTTDKGFVPMSFTNVIIPEGKKVELYMAGYGEQGNSWVNSSRPEYMDSPTENIQYDLMTYKNEVTESYSAERYRVNICRDIHFEPGAQMLHAEELIYNKAWTDVEIAPGQWTAVSTPLQGVVAGDWYAPSANGRQETEYFKDITFNATDYNRLNPAVYQRSWSTGANIVENGGGTTPVSFATEWSSAYNDASVPYVAGGGFSIKGVTSNSSLLFRFPKADTSYGVSTGTLDRENAGKLLVSGLLDRNDPLTYAPKENISVTLTPSADGKYLMVGNPFMAPIDVQEFMKENSEVLVPKYWYYSGQTLTAVAYNEDTQKWEPEGTHLAEPYSVFYVEALGNETEDETGTTYAPEVTVKLTAAMQKFPEVSTGEEGSQAASLKITAEDAEGTSSAAVLYSASASNAYGMEDAQMITNLTGNADNAPKVYTVAGNTAVSVNQLKDAQRIPLGVMAADGSVVTLTFSGVAAVKDASLYDAELKTETPLYEGYQLTVNGSSYGRYFLIGHGSGTTGISETAAEGNVSVSSIVPRQVVVTSDSALRSVSVWSAGGALLKKVTPNGSYTCTLNGVDSGMVVVRTDTESGSNVTKIRVR